MDKASKPACPKCGSSTQVIQIIYGRPSQDLIEQARKGLVKLGGCSPDNQQNHCRKCNHDFKTKPSCPKCKSSSQVIEIVYGRPSQSLIKDAQKGLVKLGGCVPDSSDNHCRKCSLDF